MCTLAIWVRQFAEAPLVVAANRDEWLARPAVPPRVLAEAPHRVGGQDLVAGGTWLAVSERGMVAGLLNRCTAAGNDPRLRSRGALPLAMLDATSATAAEALLSGVDGRAYNPFNLVVADAIDAWVAQNREDGLRVTRLPAGIHVLTNLDVNDPTCPRIARSTTRFTAAGEAFAKTGNRAAFRAAIADVLADHTTPPDATIPPPFGALCVHAGEYGTRSSSLLFLDPAGRWEHWFADGPPCRTAFAPALGT